MDIAIENLSHEIGGLPILSNINIKVERGEIVVILGPSGCGKSTLLQLIGGNGAPAAGRIRTAANPAAGGTGSIANVFQDPLLLPWRTVAGNVSLPLEHLDISRSERERRVSQAIASVDLVEFAQAYPKALSGGMRQRVSIARALVVNPSLLLMDEPLASLDAETRESLLVDLVRLWRECRFTCLYVTHDPSEAVRMGHRVVVLTRRPGSIREIIPIGVPLGERHDAHPDLTAEHARIRALVLTSIGNAGAPP